MIRNMISFVRKAVRKDRIATSTGEFTPYVIIVRADGSKITIYYENDPQMARAFKKTKIWEMANV